MRYTYTAPHDASRVDHVGTYTRPLPVSLERMYENALDWQHLPHLHASSFTEIECLHSGGWGWRARVKDHKDRVSLLELCLERERRRWITRNLEGPNEGAEIWSHVFVTAPRQMDIVIDYFVPGVAKQEREKVGKAYARAYELLYDEDVFMMTERQRLIDQRLNSMRSEEVWQCQIPLADELPMRVEFSSREFLINHLNGKWVVYPAVCPHQLGPLTGDIDCAGQVTCPWHGYTFDIATGQCINVPHVSFGVCPMIQVQGDHLILNWAQVSVG